MVVWPWLVLELYTVLALTQLGVRQSDWWRTGLRSTNFHIVVEWQTTHWRFLSSSMTTAGQVCHVTMKNCDGSKEGPRFPTQPTSLLILCIWCSVFSYALHTWSPSQELILLIIVPVTLSYCTQTTTSWALCLPWISVWMLLISPLIMGQCPICNRHVLPHAEQAKCCICLCNY